MIAGRFGHHRHHLLERDVHSPYCLPYTTEKDLEKRLYEGPSELELHAPRESLYSTVQLNSIHS